MHLLKREKLLDIKISIANLLGHLLKYHITIHEYKRLIRLMLISESDPYNTG